MGTGRRGKRKEEYKTNPSLELPRWPNSKEFICQCRRLSFDPWLGKIPGEGMATCSSILAWEITCTEEPGGPQSMGSQKS